MVAEDIRVRVLGYIQHQAQKPRDTIASLVEESQGRLYDLVSPLSEEASRRKPAPDEWCIRELLLHVVDTEGSVARLVESLARGESGPLGVDPGRLPEGPDDYAALLERLRETNAGLIEAIRALPDEPDLETKALHPFFGDLNCREWAVFQRIHDADHLQHAEKIIAAVGR